MIVLASASPRRKELLATFTPSFSVVPAHIDETPLLNEHPKEYVVRVAREKAQAVSSKSEIPADALIIASDTSVVIDNDILGKPIDFQDAKQMLRRLSGRTHQVMTSLCFLDVKRNRLITDLVVTDVEFRSLSDVEIDLYWQSGEPEDKAGAYAVQGLGAMFVKSVSGSYSAVVGLPMFETAKRLSEFGVSILQGKNNE